MKTTLQAAVLAAGLVGTLEAADLPSIEVCAKYAEADHAYVSALREHAPVLAPRKGYEVAAWARNVAEEYAEALRAADARGATAAERAAWRNAKAARDAAYSEIYNDDDWVRSDVPNVMATLRNRHPGICRELYGL